MATIESNQRWKKENTQVIYLRVTKLSGIPEALRKMTEKTGLSASVYVRKILEESLCKDGFMPEKSEGGEESK